MDDLSDLEKMEPKQPTGLSARLPFLNNFLIWLVSMFRPTKEEQKNAGIYLGGEGRD